MTKVKLRHQSRGENKAFKTALELPQTTGKNPHVHVVCCVTLRGAGRDSSKEGLRGHFTI